jgi:hypothetical protein
VPDPNRREARSSLSTGSQYHCTVIRYDGSRCL